LVQSHVVSARSIPGANSPVYVLPPRFLQCKSRFLKILFVAYNLSSGSLNDP